MSNFRIYNQMLCPHIWDEYQHLDPRVRVNLLRMAYDFYKKSELPAPIIDIYLMGSIANYNWTPESDVDIHIIVDYTKLQMPPETALKTVKTVGSNWNLEHQVIMKGHKVEMNIQNVKELKPHVTGIYSLIKDQWVRKPSYQNIQIDKPTIQTKYSGLKKYIESAMNSGNREVMKKAKDYIDAFRQYGLDTVGEMSYENIVFKILRSKGLIKALKDTITATYDREMAVREGEEDFPPDDGLSDTGGNYWWMSPDLKFYSVRGMAHGDWARYYTDKVLKIKLKDKEAAYYMMLDLGWIRVGMARENVELYIEYLYGKNIHPDQSTIKEIENLGLEKGATKIRDSNTNEVRKLEVSTSKVIFPDIIGKYFVIRFGDKRVSRGVGVIYLGDIWVANTYRDTDTDRWTLNRANFRVDFPKRYGWYDSPQEVLKFLEHWYESQNKSIGETLKKGIPKNNSPYIIIGITDKTNNTISGVSTTGYHGHANLPEKRFQIPFTYWRYKSSNSTLYALPISKDENMPTMIGFVIEYLKHNYGIIPKKVTQDVDEYLNDAHRLLEVTQRDLKSNLPDIVYDRNNVDLSKMTLDNLKAMRAKEARFFKDYQTTGDIANIEKSLRFYGELDWEIKRRLSYINKPVEEGYGAGDPTTDPLHIRGERWRIKWGSRKTPMLKENKILTESMNVGIKGYSYDRKLNTLDGVANHLLDKILMPTINSLSPDQKAYFDKNRMGSVYDMLAPDGSYFQGPEKGTGIINLYISGFMTQTLQHMLKNIIRECKKLGIVVGKLTKEQSGMYKSQVIRIPVVKNAGTYSGPPEINLSNRNAYHIFKNVLQFEPDDDSGSSFSFKTQDLIDSIMSIKGDKSWVKQHGIPTRKTDPKKPEEPIVPGDEWKYQDEPKPEPEEPESDNPHDKIANQIGNAMGGPQMISFGLMPEDIQERLDLILSIAQWAKSHGYPEMYVG